MSTASAAIRGDKSYWSYQNSKPELSHPLPENGRCGRGGFPPTLSPSRPTTSSEPPLPDDLCGAVETPSSHATLPKQSGKFPLRRVNDALMEALEPVYEVASAGGVAHFEADEALPEVDA